MQLVEVKITSTVVTAPYGTLMPGTILRTSAAYAKHLVEEASAAKYITAPAGFLLPGIPTTRPPAGSGA